MTYFIAIATENNVGQILASTKTSKYKGMTKEEFQKELKLNPTFCWSFEVREIEEKPTPVARVFA